MSGKTGQTGKCADCGDVLPLIDSETREFNFSLVGDLGDKQEVCKKCNQIRSNKANRTKIGFGQ